MRNPVPDSAIRSGVIGDSRLRTLPRAAALGFLLYGFSGHALHAQTDSTDVTPCDQHQVALGSGKVSIALDSHGGTGYAWFIEIDDNNHVRLLDKGTQVLSADPQQVGATVQSWWKLEIVDSQQADVHFRLYRPWEGKDKAVQHCVAHIVIK